MGRQGGGRGKAGTFIDHFMRGGRSFLDNLSFWKEDVN